MNINSLKVLFTSLPGRYARALFNEGKRSECLDEIVENFQKLEVFFKNNEPIKRLLSSYCMNEKDLMKSWIAVGENLSFCPIFLSFIRQLVLNRRFDILNKIKYIFNVALAKYKNKRNVVVYSAVELLPEQKKKIEKLIEKGMEENTIISYKVNEKILGGIKIASEELIVDASAKVQLKQLSSYLKNIKIKVCKDEG